MKCDNSLFVNTYGTNKKLIFTTKGRLATYNGFVVTIDVNLKQPEGGIIFGKITNTILGANIRI